MGVTWSFVNFTGHWTHVCTSRHSAATGWSRAVLWTLQGTGHTSARLGTHERTKEEISRYSEKYKSRIATHPNRLAAETYKTINMDRRRNWKPADLIKDIT